MPPAHTAARPHGLPRWVRVAAVAVHLTSSTCWLSLLTAVVAVQAASTGHRDLIMVSWWARAIPVVLAVIAVGSGVVLSLVTSWGFGRWRWLLVKQAMVVALVVGGAVELVAGFDALWARACTLALLLGVVGVSMVKPGGRVKKKVAPSR